MRTLWSRNARRFSFLVISFCLKLFCQADFFPSLAGIKSSRFGFVALTWLPHRLVLLHFHCMFVFLPTVMHTHIVILLRPKRGANPTVKTTRGPKLKCPSAQASQSHGHAISYFVNSFYYNKQKAYASCLFDWTLSSPRRDSQPCALGVLSSLSLCSLVLTLTLLCLLPLNVSGGYPSPCYQSDRRIQ